MELLSLQADVSLGRTLAVVLAVSALAAYDLVQRWKHRPTHELFAFLFGTILSYGLIKTAQILLQPDSVTNPHAMALGVLFVVLGWKALFGPWESATKATILATFLFWIGFSVLVRDPAEERLARIIAALVALVPAFLWCGLFLKYHAERWSNVAMMFCAGMLSTVPILFYDALVRRGAELEFFLFRLTPQSFNRTSQVFVSGQLAEGGMRGALLASLLSFIIVGLIEEGSKYWVLSRSGRRIFTSIDDVLQLSIIVAIGFAFAENIVNPVYFMGFVREYLLIPGQRDVAGFLTNVLGRSVLTTMVHVVSTGVMGYFLGLAIFADPYIAEERSKGHGYRLLRWMHSVLRLPETTVFRTEMIATGLLAAIALHAAFNFLVTLPDMLPHRPHTLGELVGLPGNPLLQMIPILLVPSLFYVVGGFWMLTELVLRSENQEERGHVIPVEIVVDELPEEA